MNSAYVLTQASDCYSDAIFGFILAERMVGLGKLEFPTSPLSGVRSNQLSYRPKKLEAAFYLCRS